MQTSFSFTRLGLLIKKQWAEHSRFYALATAALFGLMAIAFYIWSLTGDTDIAHTYIFLAVGLFAGGSIFASTMFSDLSQRTTGIYWLSVPATHAEKLVCAILYSQVFFNAVLTVIFFAVRSVTLSALHLGHHMYFRDSLALDEFSRMVTDLGIIYFSVQTLFLLGSVYFERLSFIKTVVSSIGVVLVFLLLMKYVVTPILPSLYSGGVHLAGPSVLADSGGYYSLPDWAETGLKYIFQYIWVPVFWAAAYFRLKEKEL